MRSVHLPVVLRSSAWWELARRFAGGERALRRPGGCWHRPSVWQRLTGDSGKILVQGSWYCTDRCLERALAEVLRQVASTSRRSQPRHRIPLGLLLISRQQLTAEQLRVALAAQRAAGRGRLGEWLERLGFASEPAITAALARQWSCPVLRSGSWLTHSRPTPQLPVALLEAFAMAPVDFVAASSTLHMAFGEALDYGVLYAIEQMTGLRTHACMASPAVVREYVRTVSARRPESEVVFEGVSEGAEFARIVRSYAARISASEIRMAGCGGALWVRLFHPPRPPLDLILRSAAETCFRGAGGYEPG